MTDKIQKFIVSLDEKIKNKLILRMKNLMKNPYEGSDIKKLKGKKNMYRLRIGKVRIIYQLKKNDIEIIDIDYRGNVY